MAPPRLITIGPSHYCEKARWALQRYGIEFDERKHVPVLHFFFTKGYGTGKTSTPKLVIDSKHIIENSTDILRYADDIGCKRKGIGIGNVGDARGLFPAAKKSDIDELGDELSECCVCDGAVGYFDKVLGVHVRRVIYWHVLFTPLAYELLSAGAGCMEKFFARITFPLIRKAIAKGFNLNKESYVRSRKAVDDVFTKVAELLADGRKYLTGDSFTAADLTFASLAAVIFYPEEYGAELPPIERFPHGAIAEIERYRNTPAGKFGLRVYKTHRHVVLSSTKE
eukprot:jgi/Chlat1/969/Chrsp108S01388